MFAISEAPKDAINPCEDISGIKDSEEAISEEDLEDRETSKVSWWQQLRTRPLCPYILIENKTISKFVIPNLDTSS